MMASAAARLTASGACAARMAAICESLIRRRRRTRAFCTSAGAVTTTIWSTDHQGCAAAARLRHEPPLRGAHQRMQDALQPRQRVAVGEHDLA
jgi:hypothetical protein